MAKRIAPNALQALTDALTKIFWYKSDLRSYLVAATGEPELIGSLDWTYKRSAADDAVQRMVADQDRYGEVLLTLVLNVASINSFPKLRGIDDEAEKLAEAETAVAALAQLVEPYEKELLEREKAKERLAEAQAEAAKRRSFQSSLAELKSRYEELAVMEDPHARGLALEPLLRDLFSLFDLDPRAAFKLAGEQIDGSFTLGSTHFLLEAKWTKRQTERKELDPFKAKVTSKIENTLGLFISVNGFQPAAVDFHSGAGSQILLMTGTDLYMVLDGRIDLVDLLNRKYRHASQTGEVLFEATAMA